MSKQRKKIEKAKQREKDNKKKLLAKRLANKKQQKLETLLTPQKEKLKPIINTFNTEKKNNEIMEQLKHNLKILEALEEEYDREKNQRAALNEDLESKGLKTIKEKMDYLEKHAIENLEKK